MLRVDIVGDSVNVSEGSVSHSLESIEDAVALLAGIAGARHLAELVDVAHAVASQLSE
jgi:hypothetical protein